MHVFLFKRDPLCHVQVTRDDISLALEGLHSPTVGFYHIQWGSNVHCARNIDKAVDEDLHYSIYICHSINEAGNI